MDCKYGELAERLIAPVLKTGERESVPEVRILYSPPKQQHGELSEWSKELDC